ncbi:hypothetical protein CRD59_00885 [Bifidobacterium xylocopae]|uniref:Uncharacterized protein n=1 Tax=Bifidobacterium xylocopae TaxID=2493119 RepID=A0A366KFT1_9BIFI|nr:hypothetical protein CRD59_00885 [Bifidobacterium xylocopae]
MVEFNLVITIPSFDNSTECSMREPVYTVKLIHSTTFKINEFITTKHDYVLRFVPESSHLVPLN